jgi:hypothetical protein
MTRQNPQRAEEIIEDRCQQLKSNMWQALVAMKTVAKELAAARQSQTG